MKAGKSVSRLRTVASKTPHASNTSRSSSEALKTAATLFVDVLRALLQVSR